VSLDAFAGVFKCEIGGEILFTDQPCADESKSSQVNLPEFSSSSLSVAKQVPSQWLLGYEGYTQALALSEELEVPIFIYFKADWCRYCKKLERELLYTSDGNRALSSIIKVRIKPEENSENNRFFEEIGGRGYPTILIQKDHNSKPRKRYLMARDSGSWKTKGLDYLKSIIGE